MATEQGLSMLVVTGCGCALFVTSLCDVKFTFRSNVLAKFFDTMHIIMCALSLFIDV